MGDRVAAVVADSPAKAEQACQLIEVDYEILPHVTEPIAAMEQKALVIHDEPYSYQIHDAQHNIAGEVFLEKGDVATGFGAADLGVERTYYLPAGQHFYSTCLKTKCASSKPKLVLALATSKRF